MRWWYAHWELSRPIQFKSIALHAQCVGGFLAWNARQNIDVVIRLHPMEEVSAT